MRVGVAVGVVVVSTAAMAMSIRSSTSVLAWSKDGDAALLAVDEDGPEGGGSLRYVLISAGEPTRTEALVSSDFSPGGPSRPQRVSEAACREAVTALGKAMGGRFDGVALEVSGCGAHRQVVTVSEEQRQRTADLARARPPFAVKVEGPVLIGTRDGQEVLRAEVRGKPKVLVGPGAKLVLVLAKDEHSTWLAQAFSLDGKKYRPLELP